MSVAITLYIMYSFLGKRFHILKSSCVCCTLFRVDLNNSASVYQSVCGCLGRAFRLLRRSPEYSTFKSVLCYNLGSL